MPLFSRRRRLLAFFCCIAQFDKDKTNCLDVNEFKALCDAKFPGVLGAGEVDDIFEENEKLYGVRRDGLDRATFLELWMDLIENKQLGHLFAQHKGAEAAEVPTATADAPAVIPTRGNNHTSATPPHGCCYQHGCCESCGGDALAGRLVPPSASVESAYNGAAGRTFVNVSQL